MERTKCIRVLSQCHEFMQNKFLLVFCHQSSQSMLVKGVPGRPKHLERRLLHRHISGDPHAWYCHHMHIWITLVHCIANSLLSDHQLYKGILNYLYLEPERLPMPCRVAIQEWPRLWLMISHHSCDYGLTTCQIAHMRCTIWSSMGRWLVGWMVSIHYLGPISRKIFPL